MKKADLIKIEIMPKNSDSLFEQRETGVTHTPYKTELLLFSCIEAGDLARLNRMMQNMDKLVVGRLSKNDTRQMQYAAVSAITLAIRAAIGGGMNESDAYDLSDRYIQKIDELNNPADIINLLAEKMAELTRAVHEVKQQAKYSKHIRICLNYINLHLHNKIMLSDLSSACGLSSDYLSFLFKKETGTALNTFIMKQKLSAAKTLIQYRQDHKGVGLIFAFCSESHFISCFKKEFGITPLQYADSLK